MIERYWTTGIILKFEYCGGGKYGWWASIEFFDNKFAEDDSTMGTLSTVYSSSIESAIDSIRVDMERLGIVGRGTRHTKPMLYYVDDGKGAPPPPTGWKELLREQATRIGWETYK